MLDITKQQLYIKHIISVFETHLPRRFIPMDTPRRTDCFIYVLSGTCTFGMDDSTQHQANAGDVIFLPKGKDYSIDVTSDDYQYLICNFVFNTTKPLFSLLISLKNPPAVEKQFRKLLHTFSVSAPDRRPKSMSILYEIYCLLIQNNLDQYVPGSARVRIESARNYIQENITDPNLSVHALAKTARMSEVHFRKLFMDLYATSPYKFVITQRVHYAKKLMGLDELQLEDIALQSGFSSLPHFCRVFKSVTGTTPAAYRKKIQSES